MSTQGPLIPQQKPIPLVGSPDELQSARTRILATRNADLIRQWAERRQATPATGEASGSGPATSVSVNDEGAGIRFNFPGLSPFRDITWAEWLEHFARHELVFVFEDTLSDGTMSNRYRMVRATEWDGHFSPSLLW